MLVDSMTDSDETSCIRDIVLDEDFKWAAKKISLVDVKELSSNCCFPASRSSLKSLLNDAGATRPLRAEASACRFSPSSEINDSRRRLEINSSFFRFSGLHPQVKSINLDFNNFSRIKLKGIFKTCISMENCDWKIVFLLLESEIFSLKKAYSSSKYYLARKSIKMLQAMDADYYLEEDTM